MPCFGLAAETAFSKNLCSSKQINIKLSAFDERQFLSSVTLTSSADSFFNGLSKALIKTYPWGSVPEFDTAGEMHISQYRLSIEFDDRPPAPEFGGALLIQYVLISIQRFDVPLDSKSLELGGLRGPADKADP